MSTWKESLCWSALMIAVFTLRVVSARQGLNVAGRGEDASSFVNTQALLCFLTGLGWAAPLYLFDTGVMDQRFNFRLMIVAATLAFPVSSLAVFNKVFFAYLLGLAVPLLVFIATHAYVRPWDFLFLISVFYIVIISIVSLDTNRHIQKVTAEHLTVLTLTEKLQHSLDTESRLRTELAIRAETDDLTGIYNRRGLLTHLNLELAKCRRFPRSSAVLMIDIDRFKEINDTQGHACGDTAILSLVDTVKRQLRDTDVFGRLGGDEFLILLPAMEMGGAIVAAERIRDHIEKAVIASPDGFIQITSSIGVASYTVGDDTDRLLARADHALYAAKNNGRNRVAVDGQPVEG
jgi:diguanylate cyclase (GGDEF)-like protein